MVREKDAREGEIERRRKEGGWEGRERVNERGKSEVGSINE